MKTLHMLALSGGISSLSSCTALLRAAQLLAPTNVQITLFSRLAEFGLCPEQPPKRLPPAVVALQSALASVDGIIIASPEVRDGLSDTLSNALRWVNDGVVLRDKPTMLLTLSPRTLHAQISQAQRLRACPTKLIIQACATITLQETVRDPSQVINDAASTATIRSALHTFADAILTMDQAELALRE